MARYGTKACKGPSNVEGREREGTEIDPSDRAVSSDGVRGGSDADFHDFGIDGCVAV